MRWLLLLMKYNDSSNHFKYNSMVLYDVINSVKVADILADTSYTFTCPALELQKFQIICSTNQNPIIPSNPDPNDGAIGVATETNLSWIGGDPDSSDTVNYDIYFGTNNPPPKVMNKQSTTTYNPGKLENNTIYYWKITACDSHGATISGPTWSFTTKNSKESNAQETTTEKVALDTNYPSKTISIRRAI